MKNLLFLTLTIVSTTAWAQHKIVFETGDTISCQITNVSNAYIHFLNDEGAGRKAAIPFVGSVYYSDKWWSPSVLRNAYGREVEIDERSFMRVERRRNESPSALLKQSGRLLIAGTTVPVIAVMAGFLIDGDVGIVIAAVGAVVGFGCLIAGGVKLRNAGFALERYEQGRDTKPGLQWP